MKDSLMFFMRSDFWENFQSFLKCAEKENELYEGKLIHFYGEASYAFQKKVRMNIYFEKYINTRV